MKEMMCSMYFNNDISLKTYELVIGNLGFEPKIINIHYEESNEKYQFNEEKLISLLKAEYTSIYIQNKSDNEDNSENFVWTRIDKDSAYNISSITWRNLSLDFLLFGSHFNEILNLSNLICCYCYNYNDAFDQSYEQISYHLKKGNKFITKKNQFGNEIVDTSKNWGRYVKLGGLQFMAAPLMWFGNPFYDIITKEKLLEVKGSEIDNNGLVKIKLFDLEEYPIKEKSRIEQEKFWKKNNLENVIKSYVEKKDKEDGVDFLTSIKNYVSKKKK